MPREPKHKDTTLYRSEKTKTCEICGFTCNAKGMGFHRSTCTPKAEGVREAAEWLAAQHARLATSGSSEGQSPTEYAATTRSHTNCNGTVSEAPTDMQHDENHRPTQELSDLDVLMDAQELARPPDMSASPPFIADCPDEEGGTRNTSGARSPSLYQAAAHANSANSSGSDPGFVVDDIMTVYHHASGLPPKVERFEDYGLYEDASESTPLHVNPDPTARFGSRAEFEFAELALEASLNRQQLDRLLKVTDKIRQGAAFSFKTHKDVETAWEKAARWHVPFKKEVLHETYNKQDFNLEVQYRDIWRWALDLVADPKMYPRMRFNAERLFKWSGSRWIRFWHEPWTAQLWWDAQTSIPAGARPICFILYADKTRLSSMGHVQGYPAMAEILNFGHELRRGRGPAGGKIIGWIPIVPDEEQNRGKKTFVNFKRGIWHKSFRLFLQGVHAVSATGEAAMCGDGSVGLFYPIVLILSADYEEQCTMALNRGLRGLCPCPVCVIPRDLMYNLWVRYARRDVASTKAIILHPTMSKTAKDAEMKRLGLRLVPNVFWEMPRCDPYRAVSFDRLHSNHLGLFGDHLWPEFKSIVEDLGRSVMIKIDTQVDRIPRWRNLNHFSAILHVEFSDGTKFQDIAKSLVFAAQHAVNEDDNTALAYLLLRCIRAYLEHDMFLALEVHTEETIALGQAALQRLGVLIEVYSTCNPSKSWSFIKMHYQTHSYEHIMEKGVSGTYDTKPFEAQHHGLKRSYQLRTNYRNFADQILRVDQFFLAAGSLRADLDLYDQYKSDPDLRDAIDAETRTSDGAEAGGRVYLGSRCKPIFLGTLEASKRSDLTFRRFRSKLSALLGLRPLPEQKIQECRYLKVQYESLVTWRLETDYLRCNPSFFGLPRYDGVLIRLDDGSPGPQFPLALVLPMDMVPHNSVTRKDKHLGLYRVRSRPPLESLLIPVDCIVRGALLSEDPLIAGDYFVVDLADTDWFLRCHSVFR